jgi:hypothetical protein
MYSSTHSVTSAIDGGEWPASHPGRFTFRERAPGKRWIGGWVGPRAVLDALCIYISEDRSEHSFPTSFVESLITVTFRVMKVCTIFIRFCFYVVLNIKERISFVTKGVQVYGRPYESSYSQLINS